MLWSETLASQIPFSRQSSVGVGGERISLPTKMEKKLIFFRFMKNKTYYFKYFFFYFENQSKASPPYLKKGPFRDYLASFQKVWSRTLMVVSPGLWLISPMAQAGNVTGLWGCSSEPWHPFHCKKRKIDGLYLWIIWLFPALLLQCDSVLVTHKVLLCRTCKALFLVFGFFVCLFWFGLLFFAVVSSHGERGAKLFKKQKTPELIQISTIFGNLD